MRGNQRPMGTDWSKPCLPPLGPLDFSSAKKTLLAISDLPHDDPDVDSLIHAVACLPLPLTLMAHLSQYEPPAYLLQRYAEEGTSMLKIGEDRTNDMDRSIEMSLNSPRLMECPDAMKVLQILRHAEQGISRTAPSLARIPSVQKCISALCQTSLVSEDNERRLWLSSPMKTYLTFCNG